VITDVLGLVILGWVLAIAGTAEHLLS